MAFPGSPLPDKPKDPPKSKQTPKKEPKKSK